MSERRITNQWTEQDVRFLAANWTKAASILILSMFMGRTASSIQTHASRKNLPKRNEFLEIDRRRWDAEDDARLEEIIAATRLADGRIPIVDVAHMMGRTIDAVAMRLDLLKVHPSSLQRILYVPDSLINDCLQTRRIEAVKDDEEDDFSDFDYEDLRLKPNPAMRTCLTCSKPFYSEGIGNRRCAPCKKRD